LTEQDDIIIPLLRGAPHLRLAMSPAPAGASPWLHNPDLHNDKC